MSRRSLTVVWRVVPVLAGLSGCVREEPQQFAPSAEVAALTDDLADDPEALKTYQQLQRDISAELTRRCGRANAPLLLGQESTLQTETHLQRGAELYARYCVQCHGVNGDGAGQAAVHLKPRPRDYTQGVFKFTSTSNGKPRRADLILTVRRGVRGTSMPSFAEFAQEDLEAVVDYVLALTYRGELQRQLAQIAFDDEELPDKDGIDGLVDELLAPWQKANRSVVMPLTPMPEMTAESIAAGHATFLKFACSRCHGVDGRGGSLGNVEVGKDMWGYKAAAADLTSGMFRGGGRPIDIYRRIYAGINGAPMGAFKSQFENDPDAIWHLVHFVKSTGQRRRLNLPAVEPTAEVLRAAGLSTASPGAAAPAAGETPAEEASPEESSPEEAPAEEAPVEEAAAQAA